MGNKFAVGKCCLDAAIKVKTIMGKTFFYCRQCGTSHQYKRQADYCCHEQKRNQSGQRRQAWRNQN